MKERILVRIHPNFCLSLNASFHLPKEKSKFITGPSDDLVSLFYAAIEMILGCVPWKQAKKSEEVKALKEAIVRLN